MGTFSLIHSGTIKNMVYGQFWSIEFYLEKGVEEGKKRQNSIFRAKVSQEMKRQINKQE